MVRSLERAVLELCSIRYLVPLPSASWSCKHHPFREPCVDTSEYDGAILHNLWSQCRCIKG
jgi:hypothetical protein